MRRSPGPLDTVPINKVKVLLEYADIIEYCRQCRQHEGKNPRRYRRVASQRGIARSLGIAASTVCAEINRYPYARSRRVEAYVHSLIEPYLTVSKWEIRFKFTVYGQGLRCNDLILFYLG